MTNSQEKTPHILIIGAGISGLALAHGLAKHHIPFTLFERDTSQTYRAQGYRLRVAAEGLSALHYLLPKHTWDLFELTCADMRLRPIPGVDAVTGEGEESGAPPMRKAEGEWEPRTVDRTVLREVLLRGLEGGRVEYGRSFERFEESGDGGVVAHFADGSTARGSLIVGADGSHSPVRKQFLPGLEILDTGGRCIYGKTPLTKELRATLPGEILGGMTGVKDRSGKQTLSMVVEPTTFPKRAEMEREGFKCPEDYLYWVLVSKPQRMGFELKDGFSHLPGHDAEVLARKVTENWHESVKAIVDGQQVGQTATLPIRSVTPNLPAWTPNPHVTLMGDAVHLMGPTAGSGAITALRDAYHLCKTLVEKGQSKESIGEYESTMRDYASKTVELSWMGGKHIFGMRRWDEEEEACEREDEDSRTIGQVMEEIREKRGR